MVGTVHAGRYRILRKLGEGGMGEVYLAEHLVLRRHEALKILHVELASDPDFVARFRREARATNRVQHANIVGVYDFGQLPDGRFFLAMEYAEGDRLDSLLERVGALPVARTLHILAQLADAIDHAHARGVVHRDLKPANLMLTQHRGQLDVLKVLDFGIAKIIAPEYQDSVAPTRQDEVFGTPDYMAPEHLAGMVDPRSDLYALGCIGFELLCKQAPFTGRQLEIVNAHMTQPPRAPSQLSPWTIPPQLDAVILRCLEKSPDLRFQTGRELRVALEQVPGFGTHKVSTGPRRTPVVGDFDHLETHESERGAGMGDHTAVSALPEEIGRAETVQLPVEVLRHSAEELLLELAEALVDQGLGGVHLLISVAALKEAKDELARVDAQINALEARITALEQTRREREAALRFALGELLYVSDQQRLTGRALGDLDHQIGELERRLGEVASELTGEVDALTEESIDRALGRAVLEERLHAAYGNVEQLVDETLQDGVTPRRHTALIERYQATREHVRLRAVTLS